MNGYLSYIGVYVCTYVLTYVYAHMHSTGLSEGAPYN